MNLIELILDEDDAIGVEAISVVENPAIESDFIALNNQEIQLAEINKEKRLLMGALLIPKKPIYRRDGEKEYYVFFSKDTVLREANESSKNFEQHLSHLGIHGLLHLLGYSHDKEKEALIMEGIEVEILNDLGIPNPYEVKK